MEPPSQWRICFVKHTEMHTIDLSRPAPRNVCADHPLPVKLYLIVSPMFHIDKRNARLAMLRN